jgi:hypothetical protein
LKRISEIGEKENDAQNSIKDVDMLSESKDSDSEEEVRKEDEEMSSESV